MKKWPHFIGESFLVIILCSTIWVTIEQIQPTYVEAAQPTVKQGMRNSTVQRVQQQLRHHGYQVSTDGIFGTQTRQAVQRFQRANGLYADGIVGSKTWLKLQSSQVHLPQPVIQETISLNVPYINQYRANAPMGCEASALLQALQYKGYAKRYEIEQFLKEMPIASDGNPSKGFGGTPYKVVKGVYQSIFAQPLAQWGNQYGKATDISGSSLLQLRQELKKLNPVVVYVTMNFQSPTYKKYDWGTGIYNAHVLTLSGYKQGYYQVTDPARGRYWVEAKKFEAAYLLTKSAVVIR